MTDKLSSAGATGGEPVESLELQTRLTREQMPTSEVKEMRRQQDRDELRQMRGEANTDVVSRSATDDLAEKLHERSGRPLASDATARGVAPEDALPQPGGAPRDLLPEARGEKMGAYVERLEPKEGLVGGRAKAEDDKDTLRDAAAQFDRSKERLFEEQKPGMLERAGESIQKGATAEKFQSLGESMAHGRIAETAGKVGEKIKHAGESLKEGMHKAMAPILTSQADVVPSPKVEMTEDMKMRLTDEQAVNAVPTEVHVHQQTTSK